LMKDIDVLMNPRCWDAEYMDHMLESLDDNLLSSQILSSMNCEYILIRSPPPMLSFYSVSDETLIQTWNSINLWTLYPSNGTETVQISDDGCVTWSDDDEGTTLYQTCHHDLSNDDHSALAQSSKNTNSDSISLLNQMFKPTASNPSSWVPLALLIGIFIVSLCIFFMLCIRPRLRNENKDELGGNRDKIAPAAADHHEEQWTPRQVDELLPDDKIEMHMMEEGDLDDGNDDYINYPDDDDDDEDAEENKDVESEEEPMFGKRFTISAKMPSNDELRIGMGQVSSDVFVATGIESPSMKRLREEKDKSYGGQQQPIPAMSEIIEDEDAL